jgi:diketogulonate reductase-like aldo/keto reductase
MTTVHDPRTRPLGETGERIARIGLGTWELERADPVEAERALNVGLDLGMTHVDTAEMYGDGAVEELLGRWLAPRRAEVFLASKVLPGNASRAGTRAACERSLRRLRTDRLDLYLLHWRGAHPLAETIGALEELRAEGKIRHYGVSNLDADELAEAAESAGPGGVTCDQVLYHLEERAVEHRVLPACARSGATLVAYSPFGSSGARFPGSGTEGGRVLAELATARGVVPRAVALAFLTRDGRVAAIPKSAQVAHVRENAAALALELTPEEIARIDAAFPLGPEPRSLPTI